MLPAITRSPPKRFTPRRWALESRPLRVEPAPFFEAKSLRSSSNIAGLLYQRGAKLQRGAALQTGLLAIKVTQATLDQARMEAHAGPEHYSIAYHGATRRVVETSGYSADVPAGVLSRLAEAGG